MKAETKHHLQLEVKTPTRATLFGGCIQRRGVKGKLGHEREKKMR